ncbi:PA14 domain-containing protein [Halobacillus amylolyticus]|uniref:PA14 domain-containing protein n=1 Tax=Halobacillus amylolyticus TaxID=2932259 RepID=A0ABY4HBK9_9BACI|nr:PA14 domain-containing protein [Halobacillus amylolyticus]UOR11643.1 PA14 domain-containing protein [Halobacillus amylolyticus]
MIVLKLKLNMRLSLFLALIIILTPLLGKEVAKAAESNWSGAFYNNQTLSGTSIPASYESLSFNWGNSSPKKGVHSDYFSSRFSKKLTLSQKQDYFVKTFADDGIRVKVDGKTVIDRWSSSAGEFNQAFLPNLQTGTHEVTVDYFDRRHGATQFADVLKFGDWIGYYYDNKSLEGNPMGTKVFYPKSVRSLQFDHGYNSPNVKGIGKGDFSAEFYTAMRIPAGKYVLKTIPDDGIRVYIDGKKALDYWQPSDSKEKSNIINVEDKSSGEKDVHWIKIEYFENGGKSKLDFKLTPLSEALSSEKWLASHYNSTSPMGNGIVETNKSHKEINFKWGFGSPYNGIRSDYFSSSFFKRLDPNQNYFVKTFADDRVRVSVNGDFVLNRWSNSAGEEDAGLITGLEPSNIVQVDYMDNTREATLLADVLPVGDWMSYYYNNNNLDGTPVYKEQLDGISNSLSFDHGYNSPSEKVSKNEFTASFTTYKKLSAGKYLFNTKVDDGIRIYVDDNLVVNQWGKSRYQEELNHVVEISDLKGREKEFHKIRIEYREFEGKSRLDFKITPFNRTFSYDSWTGIYYNDRNLSGVGKISPNSYESLDFTWGFGSPMEGIKTDYFSASFYKKIRAGKDYFVQTYADDRVQVSVNDNYVIDRWSNSSGEVDNGVITNRNKDSLVKVNYMDNTRHAKLKADIVPFNDWIGYYYNNVEPKGAPDAKAILSGVDNSLSFDHGYGRPLKGINEDDFSANFTTYKRLDPGRYVLNTKVDDGIRIYVDGELVINQWQKNRFNEDLQHVLDIQNNEGSNIHEIKIHYKEFSGKSKLDFEISPIHEVLSTDSYLAAYFNQSSPTGIGVIDANSPIKDINFSWNSNASLNSISTTNNFSASYHKLLPSNHDYFVQTYTKDKVRVKVNGKEIINNWSSNNEGVAKGYITNLKSPVQLQIDYSKNSDNGMVMSDVVPFGDWIVHYYNNKSLSGTPVANETIKSSKLASETALDIDHGQSSPIENVNKNQHSATYTTYKRLQAGDYIVRTQADDGIRVYLDGKLILDQWENSTFGEQTTNLIKVRDHSNSGKDIHEIKVEYYDDYNHSKFKFSLLPVKEEIPEQGWIGLYYPNENLNNATAVEGGTNSVKQLDRISKYWLEDKPKNSIPEDNFSASFYRYINGNKDYFVQTFADDGVRLSIDDNRVIDAWHPSPGDIHRGLVTGLSNTNHRVQLDYFDQTSNAVLYNDVVELGDWVAYYYGNNDLNGYPVNSDVFSPNSSGGFTDNYNQTLDRVPNNNISTRYTTAKRIEEGSYHLNVNLYGGVQVLIDGEVVIDRRYQDNEQDRTVKVDIEDTPNQGNIHWIEVRYFNESAKSNIKLSLTKYNERAYLNEDSWTAEYYPNVIDPNSNSPQSSNGVAYIVDGIDNIEFDWENNSPHSMLPSDEFSVIFRKELVVNEDTAYDFSVLADDGVIVEVDGERIIDSWKGSDYELREAKNHYLTKGSHTITVKYFEGSRRAAIELSYKQSVLKEVNSTYTSYELSLDRMVNVQMTASPATDIRYKLYIREDGLLEGTPSAGFGTVDGGTWNIRRGPGTSFQTGAQVTSGDVFPIRGSVKGSDGYMWHHITSTNSWVVPTKEDLAYYVNPNNFTGDFRQSLQFLKLSDSGDINIQEVNEKILQNKGILKGKAKSFEEAGKKHGVNIIYLIAHALLESGNGNSELSTGVVVDGEEGRKVVYNMYGIGAYDNCALACGSQYAYDAGWFTPEAAIIGGAQFIGDGYVNAGLDTLYKMRFNPEAIENNGKYGRQYATDIGWAYKQTRRIYELYNLLESYSITLDIPRFK